MDLILQAGIAFIVAFQGLGNWLALPMRFFTFLGSEEFFLLVFPALYWSINAGLGVRVGAILLISNGLNDMLKLVFSGPRPYWFSSQVKALAFETSFGVPSGHAQNAVATWGTLAAYIKRPWAWVIALALILLVGLSRIYLGVHFPHDVLLGWLIGAALLWAFLRFSDPLTAWLKGKSLGVQIGLALALSILMLAASFMAFAALQSWVLPAEWAANVQSAGAGPDEVPTPINVENSVSGAGAIFGFLAGLAWITAQGGFSTEGKAWQRVARYVIGLVGLLILWYGLGRVFPRDASFLAYVLRYLRYALVGAWITAGAPYLFLLFKLAIKKHSKLPQDASEM
jgi:membrane-associated phospholipid phosphatase